MRYPEDYSSVTFRLNPNARWHDGEPITVSDVIWSFEVLKEANPMLGHRGCRLGVSYPEIYEMQVRAIIEAALEVFRLEKGNLPERLDSLVEVGLLRTEDLRYPWRDDYYYRRTSDRQFILLPPLR